MVQIIKHGIGKEDHIYTTIKGLPRSDRECQLKFGFDNMLTLRNYQILPKERRTHILDNALNEINAYFATLKWEYLFENKANLVTITFLNIQDSDLEDYEISISEIINQLKDKICNFHPKINRDNNHQEIINFHIRNCGFIPEEKDVMTNSQNVITKHNKVSSQNGSEKEKMSSQNQNVITKPKKEKFIHLRISTSNKTKIQEKAKKAGYTSVSKYIIDVMTDRKNVITPQGNISKTVMTKEKSRNLKLCCQQLLGLFDEIFKIEYPNHIINKLLELLNGIDSDLIDTVKGYLNE